MTESEEVQRSAIANCSSDLDFHFAWEFTKSDVFIKSKIWVKAKIVVIPNKKLLL